MTVPYFSSPVPWIRIATARRSLALKKLYVGNLPFSGYGRATQRFYLLRRESLRRMLPWCANRFLGSTTRVRILSRSNSDEEAERAIQGLNGHDFMGRKHCCQRKRGLLVRVAVGGGGTTGRRRWPWRIRRWRGRRTWRRWWAWRRGRRQRTRDRGGSRRVVATAAGNSLQLAKFATQPGSFEAPRFCIWG